MCKGDIDIIVHGWRSEGQRRTIGGTGVWPSASSCRP